MEHGAGTGRPRRWHSGFQESPSSQCDFEENVKTMCTGQVSTNSTTIKLEKKIQCVLTIFGLQHSVTFEQILHKLNMRGFQELQS